MYKFDISFGDSSTSLLDYLVLTNLVVYSLSTSLIFDTNAVLPSLGILNMKHYKLKDFDTQILAVEQKKNKSDFFYAEYLLESKKCVHCSEWRWVIEWRTTI